MEKTLKRKLKEFPMGKYDARVMSIKLDKFKENQRGKDLGEFKIIIKSWLKDSFGNRITNKTSTIIHDFHIKDLMKRIRKIGSE